MLEMRIRGNFFICKTGAFLHRETNITLPVQVFGMKSNGAYVQGSNIVRAMISVYNPVHLSLTGCNQLNGGSRYT